VNKTNLILFVLLVGCALSVVGSQHQARKLFMALEREREVARAMEVEWGQLQLEQSTWATHARVERIAGSRLKMTVPDAKRVVVVSPRAGERP
jgi:cell division protein FtsL